MEAESHGLQGTGSKKLAVHQIMKGGPQGRGWVAVRGLRVAESFNMPTGLVLIPEYQLCLILIVILCALKTEMKEAKK